MPKVHRLGTSTMDLSIEGVAYGNDRKKILLMSGLHGDEVEGILLTTQLLKYFNAPENKPPMLPLFILPIANPDGFFLNQRWNARSVDLNRNWPTKDWTADFSNPRYPPGSAAASESETQTLLRFVQENDFEMVVDLHSYKDSVLLPLLAKSEPNLETRLAKLGEQMNIPVTYEQTDLGYSIAGGFHTWCFENGISNITLEVEKGLGQFAIRDRYLRPLVEFLNSFQPGPESDGG